MGTTEIKKKITVEYADDFFIKFNDLNGISCSLERSQNDLNGSVIFLGVSGFRTRMHLDSEQIKWLIGHLQKWLNTGEF